MTQSITARNSVALVTGANRGIGKVIAEGLLAEGAARVYLAVRDPASVAGLVERYGARVQPLQLDLTQPESIAAAAAAAADVEIVINNAGVLTSNDPLSPDAVAGLQYEMATNVHGLIYVAQAFAPVLKANGGGVLVQINSVASMKNFLPFTTYSASKAAAYAITQALRDQLAEQGTRVISVHPGPMATDMGEAAGFKDVAESPTLVSDAILAALAGTAFHVFPDTMANAIGDAYQSYATNIVEADLLG